MGLSLRIQSLDPNPPSSQGMRAMKTQTLGIQKLVGLQLRCQLTVRVSPADGPSPRKTRIGERGQVLGSGGGRPPPASDILWALDPTPRRG